MLSSLKDARLSHDPPLRLIDVATQAGCAVSLVSMVESGYLCSERTRSAIAQAVGASYGSFWSTVAAVSSPIERP